MGFQTDKEWSKFKRSSKNLLQELGFPNFLFENRKRWDYFMLHEYDYETKWNINELDPANLEKVKTILHDFWGDKTYGTSIFLTLDRLLKEKT